MSEYSGIQGHRIGIEQIRPMHKEAVGLDIALMARGYNSF